jgi:hypothetical protein
LEIFEGKNREGKLTRVYAYLVEWGITRQNSKPVYFYAKPISIKFKVSTHMKKWLDSNIQIRCPFSLRVSFIMLKASIFRQDEYPKESIEDLAPSSPSKEMPSDDLFVIGSERESPHLTHSATTKHIVFEGT